MSDLRAWSDKADATVDQLVWVDNLVSTCNGTHWSVNAGDVKYYMCKGVQRFEVHSENRFSLDFHSKIPF